MDTTIFKKIASRLKGMLNRGYRVDYDPLRKNGWAVMRGVLGQDKEVEVFERFGMTSFPPEKGEGVGQAMMGVENHTIVNGFTAGVHRPRDVEEGETILYSLIDEQGIGGDHRHRIKFTKLHETVMQCDECIVTQTPEFVDVDIKRKVSVFADEKEIKADVEGVSNLHMRKDFIDAWINDSHVKIEDGTVKASVGGNNVKIDSSGVTTTAGATTVTTNAIGFTVSIGGIPILMCTPAGVNVTPVMMVNGTPVH